jgi:putative ABC transport system permease protein
MLGVDSGEGCVIKADAVRHGRRNGMFPVEMFHAAWRDSLYALRGLRRNPTFTISAVITLALGIGASTAVFSVVDRVLFRPLPYSDDSRLVSVGVTAPIERQEFMLGRQYFDWKDHQTPFVQMTSWSGLSDCDLTDQSPVRLVCARVESNFLSTFGVRPMIGSDFTPDDDRPGAAGAALITYSLWRSRFNGDTRVAGRSISLDGKSFRVAGVLPRNFALPSLTAADILVPQMLDEAAQRSSTTGAVLSVFARLKPGMQQPQAEAQLQPLLADFLKFVPPQFRNEVKLKIRSVRDRQFHEARSASWLLFWAVLAILLIGCANLANLLLARSASREQELAVRTALGAKQSRLAGLALIESLVLAICGGVAGFGLAYVLVRLFLVMPQQTETLQQATLDVRAVAFAWAASLLSGIIFGLAPALQKSRPEILAGYRSVPGPRTALRQVLIVGQIAASMALVCMAGLLMQSLWNLKNAPLGMDAGGVLTAEITLNQNIYRDNAQQLAFFEKLEERLRTLPGVTAAAISDSLPPQTPARSSLYTAIQVDGRPKFPGGTGGTTVWRTITPGYFTALQTPIVEGRDFREDDREPNKDVIILGSALARRLFPNEDPVGKRLQVNSAPPWFTVIGVAGDVRNNGILGVDEPEYYLLRSHAPDLGLGSRIPPGSLRHAAVILRSSGPLTLAAPWLVAAIHNIDPTVPVDVESMQQRIGTLTRRPRFNASLMGMFAGISILLSAVGLYGLISFLVVQRTREIGVRMALGATQANIIRLVLGHAVRWTAIGVVLGAAISIMATRAIQALLFHVQDRDPWTIVSSVLVLFTVAALSAWIPSRRAARVDPMIALRNE